MTNQEMKRRTYLICPACQLSAKWGDPATNSQGGRRQGIWSSHHFPGRLCAVSKTTTSQPFTGSPRLVWLNSQTNKDRIGSVFFLPSESLQHQSPTLVKGRSPSL